MYVFIVVATRVLHVCQLKRTAVAYMIFRSNEIITGQLTFKVYIF